MKKLIVLTGPTAVGKTALSIKLAKAIDAEIISADSMQVYKHMDIGTAKVRAEEMEGVPHHLIDILEPVENYDAFTFKEMAKAAIDDIYSRGKVPIIAGGTGFYIQAVAYDVGFSDKTDLEYREALFKEARELGALALHKKLEEKDPLSAKGIHPNNVKRVVRALEFLNLNESGIASHNSIEREKTSPYELYYFVLTMDRAKMYERINLRVDMMMEMGLLDEVERVKFLGVKEDMTAYKAIGYRQLFEYLDGKCELKDAVDKIKQDSRHYAKRQLTWFRRERDVVWIDKDKYENDEAILEYILGEIG